MQKSLTDKYSLYATFQYFLWRGKRRGGGVVINAGAYLERLGRGKIQDLGGGNKEKKIFFREV